MLARRRVKGGETQLWRELYRKAKVGGYKTHPPKNEKKYSYFGPFKNIYAGMPPLPAPRTTALVVSKITHSFATASTRGSM